MNIPRYAPPGNCPRYAYRLKDGTGYVTSDYSAKAPATSALWDAISAQLFDEDRDRWAGNRKGRREEAKRIAAELCELVTFELTIEEASDE